MRAEWDLVEGLFRTEEIPAEVDLLISMRNHLSVARGANQLLEQRWETLSEAERRQLIHLALRGAEALKKDVADYAAQVELRSETALLQW